MPVFILWICFTRTYILKEQKTAFHLHQTTEYKSTLSTISKNAFKLEISLKLVVIV